MRTNRPASTGDDGARRHLHGRPARLPDHRGGWRWKPYAVDGADVEAARQQLQRLMRDAEADIAEALSGSPGPASRSARPAARSTGLSMFHAAKLFSQNVRFTPDGTAPSSRRRRPPAP